MTPTSDIPQQPDWLLAELDTFRALARRHALPVGSPDCLVSLPDRIAQDSSLRSNLTELLRELQRSDPDFSLPDALWLLLTAVGGSATRNRQPQLDEPIDLTAGFLASVGGWPGPPTAPVTDLDHPSAHDPRLDLHAQSPAAIPQQPSKLAPRLDSDLSPGSSPASSLPINDTHLLTQLTATLARLEQSTSQLGHYLDSIDHRLSTLEQHSPTHPIPATHIDPSEPHTLVHRNDSPPPTSPTPHSSGMRRDRFSAAMDLPNTRSYLDMDEAPPEHLPAIKAPAHTAYDDAGPATEESPELPITLPKASPAAAQPTASPEPPSQAPPHVSAPHIPDEPPLAPPPTHRNDTDSVASQTFVDEPGAPETLVTTNSNDGSEFTAPDDIPSSTTDLDDLLPPKHQSNTGKHLLGALCAVVVLIALFLLFGDEPFHLHSTFSPPAASTPATPGNTPPPTSPSSTPPSSAPSTPATNPQTTPQIVPQPTPPQATPPPATAPAGTSSSSNALPSPVVPNRVPSRVLGARSAADQPTVNEQLFNAPTFVPEQTMKARLTSAPPPLYPQVVNSPGLEGQVTFQAIVSKSGTVEALTPLSGEHLLRDAAANAVRQWHFEPYLVHGQPVQVRTVLHVRVDPHNNQSVSAQ